MVESYNRMVHNRMADWPQIYIKEGASQLEQRIWLNSLLLKYCQAKEDGISRYITKHVLNIAQYLLDADEIDVPPAHIMPELLTTQRIPNMQLVIQRQLNSYLSARTRDFELSSTALAQIDEATMLLHWTRAWLQILYFIKLQGCTVHLSITCINMQ